jgi:hypothetical protein
MFAKGPQPGATPKADAMKLLPAGTECKRTSGFGMSGWAVFLPDGRRIGSAGNASGAWSKAEDWARRNLPPPE